MFDAEKHNFEYIDSDLVQWIENFIMETQLALLLNEQHVMLDELNFDLTVLDLPNASQDCNLE